MMPRSDASKLISGKEEGDISENLLNEEGLSAVVPDPQKIPCETEGAEFTSASSPSEGPWEKEAGVAIGEGAWESLYPEGGGCLLETQVTFDCNGCEISSSLSEHALQGQTDSAGDMEVPPPAEGVNGEKQVFSDVSLAQKKRSLVMKELGISSTDFIGPLWRPQEPESKTEPESKVEPDPDGELGPKAEPKAGFENELSEFYRELEELEPADCVDGSTDKDTDESETKEVEPQNPPPCGQRRFPQDRDSRRPYADRREHSDHWQPKRHRPDFQQGPHWQGPNQPFCSVQRPLSQDFRGPDWHPYHSSGYRRPPGPPLPPYPPPGPLYPPPNFGPRMNTYYDGPQAEQWKNPPFPPDTGHPSFDSSGYQQQQSHQPPHSDCDYRPAPLLVLILMRGLPGSGKTTLAKKLLSSGPNGLVLSTDDYFDEKNGYTYSASLIGDAHTWNQKRAREAMDGGRSPVIIDNTNVQAWEMKPYVKMALERGYSIDFHEPDTSWKLDPFELEKRNKHGVPSRKIAQMRDRFELPMSVDIVLNSRDPPHKTAPQGRPSRRPPR